MGFIFQFYNLTPTLTAEENVRLVTDIVERPMAPAEALDLVGLAERRGHYPAQLSGEEQQRVAVARAIAKRPGVLLCDEPTGALDSSTGVRVLQTLERAHTELGTTVIIITHNISIAAMAHRVLHFSDGRIARVASSRSRDDQLVKRSTPSCCATLGACAARHSR
ncbi:ABC transporter ATP-binding protein [Flavisphingomonas formosensis]|uniref:ABC transporter ATP-binding protein n=1 Tax=Flavisphingomonas formosensis TaxID=861534 RepID=UPI0018DF0486|nr:ATP-binding cassette domain-containing protein [Sphingomonas formosensis]